MNLRKYTVLILVPLIILLFTSCIAASSIQTPVASNERLTSVSTSTNVLREYVSEFNFDDVNGIAVMEILEKRVANIYEQSVDSVVRITTPFGGAGTGWAWDDKGHIVTNHHLVSDNSFALYDTVNVITYDGRFYEAEVIGGDVDSDLAVVKIDEGVLEGLPRGTINVLSVGNFVYALGNPFGENFTLTQGIISAIGRLLSSSLSQFSTPNAIQTDAALNPGNSGGPLLDKFGAVIGVNSRIQTLTGSSSGVGFAIPIDLVSRIVPVLIKDGEYTYPLIGITGEQVNSVQRSNYNLPDDLAGIIITQVSPGTAADEANLKPQTTFVGIVNVEDIITAIDSIPVFGFNEMLDYLILNKLPGDNVILTVYNDGEIREVVLTLGAR